MRCPYCSSDETQVRDSRPTEDNTAIRRRRSCAACGGRFTTFERIQLRELTVTKRSGRRVPFDRDKLVKSIQVALRKRPIELDRIERMANGIVRQLESSGEQDIAAETIGEMVMNALRALDAVAYVRFASVYRNFREVRDFEKFVEELADSATPPAILSEDNPSPAAAAGKSVAAAGKNVAAAGKSDAAMGAATAAPEATPTDAD